ncbi:hypothetical protein LCGC14_1473040 [marine sediment metagenome]|uniref:CR-type domain-containing protein n=1 Tax=marine sediment metagenome TaxID=412755 RepID=A0A0F9JCE6_9ZZZZ
MKTIEKCPVCGSKDLEQEYITRLSSVIIGGSSQSQPRILDGCSCNFCGVASKFDKKGECPNCDGTGDFIQRHYRSGIELASMGALSYECPTCKGIGKI